LTDRQSNKSEKDLTESVKNRICPTFTRTGKRTRKRDRERERSRYRDRDTEEEGERQRRERERERERESNFYQDRSQVKTKQPEYENI